jgi:hypothetical protein
MLSLTASRRRAGAQPFSPVDRPRPARAGGHPGTAERTPPHGVGGTVEAALFDTATASSYFLQSYWERGTEPRAPGRATVAVPEAFDTADSR